jgi:hypothetical protein
MPTRRPQVGDDPGGVDAAHRVDRSPRHHHALTRAGSFGLTSARKASTVSRFSTGTSWRHDR